MREEGGRGEDQKVAYSRENSGREEVDLQSKNCQSQPQSEYKVSVEYAPERETQVHHIPTLYQEPGECVLTFQSFSFMFLV